MDHNTFDLERFVGAQAATYEAALAELSAGRKRSHWMWFVFPQMRGLGLSPTAVRYGMVSLAEAKAYLAHAVLGPRLAEATDAVLTHRGRRDLAGIFGAPDDMKFRSSMTLFARAAGAPASPYRTALDAFCGGDEDARTLELIASR